MQLYGCVHLNFLPAGIAHAYCWAGRERSAFAAEQLKLDSHAVRVRECYPLIKILVLMIKITPLDGTIPVYLFQESPLVRMKKNVIL